MAFSWAVSPELVGSAISARTSSVASAKEAESGDYRSRMRLPVSTARRRFLKLRCRRFPAPHARVWRIEAAKSAKEAAEAGPAPHTEKSCPPRSTATVWVSAATLQELESWKAL